MLLSYKWDWVWDALVGSLCGATIRASLCDAKNGPKMVLKCFKGGQKWFKNNPKWVKNDPKMVHKWSKNSPKRFQKWF